MAHPNRPLSPHLQIYRPQLTSMLSITHRATGAFLVLGGPLLVYWLYAVAAGAEVYSTAQIFLLKQVGLLPLIALSFALFYHALNGIRHLFWDVGRGFDLPTLHRTGYAVVLLSLAATGILWAQVLGYVDIVALLAKVGLAKTGGTP
jgi:succinate dehydrogenase / fumarate reductase cytochrome b subunit